MSKRKSWTMLMTMFALCLLAACALASTVTTLPADTKVIQEEAFFGTAELREVIVPQGATTIESRAFAESGITRITLPESITFIAEDAFEGTNNLVAVVNAHSYAHAQCDNIGIATEVLGLHFYYEIVNNQSVTVTGYRGYDYNVDLIIPSVIEGLPVTKIGSRAFENNHFSGKLIIPNTVEMIDEYAFYNCSGLTGKLTIPNSVKIIGNSAFANCNGFIGDLLIPNGVKTIDDYAFSSCMGFTGDLIIADSVETIGEGAFTCCGGFRGKLVLSKSLKKIEAYTFTMGMGQECVFEGDLVIPHGVNEICEGAFTSARFTGGLVLPNTVKTIGFAALADCKFSEQLMIPEGIQNIGEMAFAYNDFIGSLIIPESVNYIEKEAFAYCAGLTELTILAKTDRIYQETFSECEGLTSVVISDAVKTIEPLAFYKCNNLKDVWISKGTTEISESAFINNKGLLAITIHGKSGSYAEKFAKNIGYKFVVGETPEVPIIDLTSAKLDKSVYAPGETITISGIRAKNATNVHISGNNTMFVAEDNPGTYDVALNKSSEYQTLPDIRMTLREDAVERNDFYFSVQASDDEGNQSYLDTTTLRYAVDAGAPDVISAEFIETDAYLNEQTTAVVRTDSSATRLYMYAENRDFGRCAIWTLESCQTEVEGSERVWRVQYAFNVPGERTLSFAASANGIHEGEEKTASITIKDTPPEINVRNFDLSRYIAELGNTIGILGTVDGGDSNLALVTVSLHPDGDAEQGVEIWRCEPNALQYDLNNIPSLIVGKAYEGVAYVQAKAANRNMLIGAIAKNEVSRASTIGITMEPGKTYDVAVDVFTVDGRTIAEENISRTVVVRETTVFTGEVATRTSEAGKNFIKAWEKCYLYVYDDATNGDPYDPNNPIGKPTIGWGHLIKDGESFTTITQEEADAMFEDDLKEHEGRAIDFIKNTGAKVNQQQFDALSSFFYNGNSYAQKSASCMFKLFQENANCLESIPAWRIYNQFANYHNKDEEKVRVGLFKRRLDEAKIFTEGIYKRNEDWFIEDWVSNGGAVPDNWHPRELDEHITYKLEAPEFLDYPDIVLPGQSFNVTWTPVEGAKYYKLWYRPNTWVESKYLITREPQAYLSIDSEDSEDSDEAEQIWLTLFAMVDETNHSPDTFQYVTVSNLGDVAFNGYTLGGLETIEIDKITPEGFPIGWTCQNAVKYNYKVLVLDEKPAGNDQSNDAVHTYTGTVTGSGMFLLEEWLEAGKYLKLAVQPVDVNGLEGYWLWTGFHVINGKPKLSTPVLKSVPASAVSGETVTVEWNEVEGALYYNLWYSIDGKNKKCVRVDAPACSATFVPISSTDTTLYISLYALTSPDNWSEFSANAGIPLKGVNAVKMSKALYQNDDGRLTCGFDGYKTISGRHEGIDFALGYGKDVYALVEGKITDIVKGDEESGLLSTIAIYNENANKTVIYLHSNPLDSLKVGEYISSGEKIATENWRGCSSEKDTHTHVEVRNGERKRAAISKDPVLDNEDPTSFWNAQGYSIE